MADRCDPNRAEVADLQRQLDDLDPFIIDPDDGGPRPRPRPNPQYRRVAALLRAATARLGACLRTLDPPIPPTPVPVALRARGLRCFDQNDTDRGGIFDIEDDEPYVLAFAVDLLAPTNSKMTRVGPISDVDDDEEDTFFALPANLIWGLSEVPQLISSADNLICIVALMENDNANPNQVRELVEIDVKVRLLTEGIAFAAGQIPRAELVRRLINAVNGSLPIASVAFPGPDDQIGSAQELRFTQDELDTIYRDGGAAIEKKLFFEGDDSKYDVYFRMSR